MKTTFIMKTTLKMKTTSRWSQPQNEDNIKNENDIKNEDDLENEASLKNEEGFNPLWTGGGQICPPLHEFLNFLFCFTNTCWDWLTFHVCPLRSFYKKKSILCALV